MFRFRMDIAGDVQIDRGIARFADAVSDYRGIWPVIEDDFYAQEKDQFKTEGEEGGEKWQALSPSYAGWKERHFPGKPILERTGNLMKSLTSGTDPNSIKIEGRKMLTLGTKLPYAIYHQSLQPRKVLPWRPEIKLTEAFARSVMHHIQTYLVQIASMSGFRTGLGPIQSAKFGAGRGMGVSPHSRWKAGEKAHGRYK
jgi:phage gpG-like protein